MLRDRKLRHKCNSDGWCLSASWNTPKAPRCACDITQVCVHYNRGGVPDGACTFRDSCTKLHLCLHHTQGRCRFGERCQRLHAVDHRGLKLLQERGLRAGDFIRDLPGIYQNRHHLLAAAAAATAAQQASGGGSGPQGEQLVNA